MAELNYDDFKRRVNIQDLLIDAGYSLNRRDGLRYPSYVRMGSDGKRVRGDKFIVTANGLCCFQPPEQKNYNVISFIKEHPNLFADYTPGMNTDRLVNLVCNRLLNNPIMDRSYVNLGREHIQKPFNINDYERVDFRLGSFDSQKPFYPYFKTRGINLDTQKAFHNNFFIAMKEAKNGKTYANLSFPLRKPSDLATIVGLEERSRATKTGKTIYKGMAAGSDATNGLWIATPAGTALDKVKDVYWFESAYDAMSYYQIMKDKALATKETNPNESKRTIEALDKSCFVSTAGNPSIHQYKGMMNQTENANHHLCFDRDRAGRMFAFNFLVAKDNANYRTSQPEQGVMVIDDRGEKYYTDITREDFSLEETIEHLNLNMLMKPNDLTDYMKTLRKEDDLMSGDMGYLHGKTSKAYNRYESLAEEYSSVSDPFSIPMCEEDLASMRKELNKAYNDFKESFDKANNGYTEALTREWQPIKDMRLSDKDENGAKTMNTHLHVLEPYTNLYRVWPDEGLRGQLRNLIDLFIDKIWNPDTHHLDLFFDNQWNGKRNVQSYGHDIEAVWLLHEAALVLNEAEVTERVERVIPLIAKAADEGLQSDGSLIYEHWTDSGDTDRQRQWWVMCECIIGHIDLYQHFGDRRALDIALRCWDYTRHQLIDYEQGEWFWGRHDDGSVNRDDDKAGFWKCPYHNSRMCLELMERDLPEPAS